MLITTANLLQMRGVTAGIPETIAKYDLLRKGVERAIKSFCKWGIERVAGQVDYYDGRGYRDIVIRNPFVVLSTLASTVYLDMTGYYGQGTNAFAASTVLTSGQDYAVVADGNAPFATTYARSGLLRRLSASQWWWPSDLAFLNRGGLSYVQPSGWPVGYGNIKITYSYGFVSADDPATDMPEDIQLAVVTAVGVITNTTQYGYPAQSESIKDYNYSLAISKDVAFGEVRQLLSPYRDVAISGVCL